MGLAYAEAASLGGVAQATVGVLLWLYVALFSQSYVKIALVKCASKARFGAMSYTDVHYTDPEVARIKYGVVHDSKLALVADRTAGNLLEQLIPFLAATWLRALLVPGAAAGSGRLAWGWLASRMAYPLCFYWGHPLLQLSTQPGYLIVWGQLADLAVNAAHPVPAWWSSAGCERGVWVLVLACQLIILLMWALPLVLSERKQQRELGEEKVSQPLSARAHTPRGGRGKVAMAGSIGVENGHRGGVSKSRR